MSNYSSCIKILTDLIGFDTINDGEKISLPDEVEVDTLVQFQEYFIEFISASSNEMKMSENKELENVDTFWSCNHCTFNNEIYLTTCKMCGSPNNVCIFASYCSISCLLTRWRAKKAKTKKKQQETYLYVHVPHKTH